MKILIHSYNTCFQNPSGGIKIRITKYRDLLREKGIDADFFDPVSTKLAEYDILHVYKLSYETYALILNAKKVGLKIVVSPIINLVDSKKIDFFFKFLNRFPIPTTYKIIAEIIKITDVFLVETPQEKQFLVKHYKVSVDKIKVLPNGVDISSEERLNEEIFDVLGHRSKYFLQVGRINSNKNNLNVIKALGPTGHHLILVGGPDKMNGDDYYHQCLKEAEKYPNIHFLGWIENGSSLLNSIYQNAEVLVLASYQETFGLVLLEAGIAGAKLAISRTLPILDFKVFNECQTFNPDDIVDMRRALLSAYSEEKSEDLKKALIEQFSWESIIDRLLECYQELNNEESPN